jgi:hypothetical protein
LGKFSALILLNMILCLYLFSSFSIPMIHSFDILMVSQRSCLFYLYFLGSCSEGGVPGKRPWYPCWCWWFLEPTLHTTTGHSLLPLLASKLLLWCWWYPRCLC